jgi:hypothetical protein
VGRQQQCLEGWRRPGAAPSRADVARGCWIAIGEGLAWRQAKQRRPGVVRRHVEGQSAAPTRATGVGGWVTPAERRREQRVEERRWPSDGGCDSSREELVGWRVEAAGPAWA